MRDNDELTDSVSSFQKYRDNLLQLGLAMFEWKNLPKTCSERYIEKTEYFKGATIFFEEAQKLLPKYGMTLRKDISDGDPDYEENFTVIYKAWCPAVLIESLFFTSRTDLAFLESEVGKDVCADIVVNGIKRIVAE